MNQALHVAPGVQENNTIGSLGIVIPVSEPMCTVRREECLCLTSVRPDFLLKTSCVWGHGTESEKSVVSLIVICQRSNLSEYRETVLLWHGSLCVYVRACSNSSLSKSPADRLQLQMARRRATYMQSVHCCQDCGHTCLYNNYRL